MSIFEIIVWIGTAFTLAGLVALIWCIAALIRARRKGLDAQAMRNRLREILVIKMAAVMASVLGLMLVVLGVILA